MFIQIQQIIKNVCAEEVQKELRDAFSMVDVDGSGEIDAGELRGLVRLTHIHSRTHARAHIHVWYTGWSAILNERRIEMNPLLFSSKRPTGLYLALALSLSLSLSLLRPRCSA